MRFEWDENKNKSNKLKHGVSFEVAVHIFDDPGRVERYDHCHSTHEEPWIGIGIAYPHILFVVFMIKQADTYRIISARKANAKEKREYRGF